MKKAICLLLLIVLLLAQDNPFTLPFSLLSTAPNNPRQSQVPDKSIRTPPSNITQRFGQPPA